MPILNWLDRKQAIVEAQAVPYRLLETDSQFDYGDPDSTNMLIQGDNLEALKALLPYFAGQIKCIYIDPPYNTHSAFEHYDDNLEHSTWLSMMYPRLELLRELLAEDGSIWMSIDDNEEPYVRVLMDEIFHRKNFVASVIWQKRTSPDARIHLGAAHDYIIVYARNNAKVKFSKMLLTDEQKKKYKNTDNDPKRPWVSTDFSAQGWRPNQMYNLKTPSGQVFEPPPGLCWVNVESEYNRLLSDNRMWFGKDGKGRPRSKTYLSENEGVASWTWWPNTEVGHNQEAKKEINELFGADNAFDTPKPERLIHRILHISTDHGDLVLDSFLGSGTTTAVAHKMNRRYIGIEMGEHAITFCSPRLQKVVDGEQGGISSAVNWKGGSGFHFFRLGETVFMPDGTTNPKVTFPALAAHIWFTETNTPIAVENLDDDVFLGVHNGTAYYLLYNGVLKDKSVMGGNVLTSRTLRALHPFDGPKVIYGAGCRFSPQRLKQENITFKQTPYQIKVR